MDSAMTIDCQPKRHQNSLGSLEPHSTREIESVNSDLCTMPRPPPTGEDSSENVRSKDSHTGITKGEYYECPSPRLTPRRSTAKELPASCGVSHTDDTLAPLGFEPEGEAVSSSTFREPSGNCFTDMLNDAEGSSVFYQYLRRVNCDGLMDFCRACEDFRGMVPMSPQTLSTAKAIFQQYILTRETCEHLGIKLSTRAKIAELISVQPIDPLLFEDAYSEVVAHMKNLHYKTFLNSSFSKEFAETRSESPKLVGNQTYNRRFQGGYLPTLPEEKVLGFGDEIEEFEFDQQYKTVKGGLLYCGASNSTSDEKNARNLLHVPIKDVSSPYYYPTAPVASITESESISSEALTDDTLSMTTDTSDGHSRCSGGRRTHRSRTTAPPHSRFPFVPRTHRMPKEARHPLTPDEFAKILTEKLEKVAIERQLQEREALNLAHSLDVERPGSSQSKKSILQEAIENKERRDRIPLSTMVQLPPQDDTSSISTSNHSSSKSTSARATAGSGVPNSSSSESTHRKSRGSRNTTTKLSKHENEPPVVKTNEQLPVPVYKEPKVTKDTNLPSNDNIPYLTLNHHRIQEWMATGEEELKKQKSKSHQKSRQSSSNRVDTYSNHHQPKQPIAQDPMMPLLQGPEATTVLDEVCRRLIETKEQNRKKHSQQHRSRNSVDDTSDQSSYYGKESSMGASSCSQSLLSYDLNQHQSYSSIPSSASNIGNDTKSRSDSGIGGGGRKKEKHNATTVIYWLWGEPIAYRTSLPGKHITLGQFKTQLIPRKGEFRYFFKTKTDDHDADVNVVYEAVRDDDTELPMFEGKIVGKVEKVD